MTKKKDMEVKVNLPHPPWLEDALRMLEQGAPIGIVAQTLGLKRSAIELLSNNPKALGK